MVMFQVSMALMTGKSKQTNLLFLAGIQSPLIKSLCGPLVLLDRRAQSCFAFWCLHHCNCGLSHRALLMSPYGKNKPNNMHAKQMPSSAQCSHSLIIFTWGVSQLRRQEVAFGCFIVLTGKMPEGGYREAITHSVYKYVFLLPFVAYPKWHMQNIMPWCMTQMFWNTAHLCPQMLFVLKLKSCWLGLATVSLIARFLCFKLLWLLFA